MPQKINTTSTYLHSHKLPRPVSVCLAGSTQLLKPPFSEARLCAGRESNVPPNLTSLPAQEESCGSRKSSAQTLWRIVKNISLYLAFVSSRRRRRRFWRRLFFSSSTYFFFFAGGCFAHTNTCSRYGCLFRRRTRGSKSSSCRFVSTFRVAKKLLLLRRRASSSKKQRFSARQKGWERDFSPLIPTLRDFPLPSQVGSESLRDAFLLALLLFVGPCDTAARVLRSRRPHRRRFQELVSLCAKRFFAFSSFSTHTQTHARRPKRYNTLNIYECFGFWASKIPLLVKAPRFGGLVRDNTKKVPIFFGRFFFLPTVEITLLQPSTSSGKKTMKNVGNFRQDHPALTALRRTNKRKTKKKSSRKIFN